MIHCRNIINFELFNEQLSKNQKIVQDLSNEINNLKKESQKTKKEFKKSKPIFQLSLFGTLGALVISAMGILYTADISFKLLTSQYSLVAVFLLCMVFIFTSHFLFILFKKYFFIV